MQMKAEPPGVSTRTTVGNKPFLGVLTASGGGLLGLMDQAIQPFQKLFRRQVLRRSHGVVVLLPVGGALTRADLPRGLVAAAAAAVVQQHLQAAARVQQQGDGQGLLQVDGVVGVHPVGPFDLLHLRGEPGGAGEHRKAAALCLLHLGARSKPSEAL